MTRVGLGYDIHRLEAGRKLVLGGVEIASPVGLVGHSDADVVTHALMDAMLGAAAHGDIGMHFPPDDDRFRDISSLVLLARVRKMLDESHWALLNADIVIVAEHPRLAPHSPRMREVLAHVLGVPDNVIGIKATTNEGVGAEGRQEAISAQAVVLLENRQ
ncbi:MAG: 2-C-methyl-D-erythritol 2,4-cyclodiphosphate synthase [Chloroflexota bacterium]